MLPRLVRQRRYSTFECRQQIETPLKNILILVICWRLLICIIVDRPGPSLRGKHTVFHVEMDVKLLKIKIILWQVAYMKSVRWRMCSSNVVHAWCTSENANDYDMDGAMRFHSKWNWKIDIIFFALFGHVAKYRFDHILFKSNNTVIYIEREIC